MRSLDKINSSFHIQTVLFWLCIWMLQPLSAGAQSTGVGSTQTAENDQCLQDTKCNEMYEGARALSQAGQYEAALVAYQSAFARSKAAWLLINIGRMQQKTARPQQAVVTYRRFLHDPAADDESQSKARQYLSQAEQEVQAAKLQLLPRPDTFPVSRSLYKKWWFWTAVGGAAAALAVGLGAGLGARAAASSTVPADAGAYSPKF